MNRSFPFDGLLCLDSFAGRSETPCLIVGETRGSYRIKATQEMKIAGRNRWLCVGEKATVPKSAIKLVSASIT